MTEQIVVVDEDSTRIITMRRPDKKNALTQDMYRAISAAIDSAQDDFSIRCLIITGGSGVFTAGNDVEDLLQVGTAPSVSQEPRASAAKSLLYSLANNAKPLIAAVDGVAVGIGTTMMFHCDHVVASTAARFSAPFIALGLVPEGASTLLAPRLMGHHRAFSLLVRGAPITAEEAFEAGFVNQVVSPGQTRKTARMVAREICELPVEAVAIARKMLRPPTDEMLARIDHESAVFADRMRSHEAVTAFKSFLARNRA